MFVIDETVRYFCYSEDEAKISLEEMRKSNEYEILKSTIKKKQKKAKGEVIATWYILTVTKGYNDEKDGLASNED